MSILYVWRIKGVLWVTRVYELKALHCPMAMRGSRNMDFHGSNSSCSLLIALTVTLLLFIITFHGQICSANYETYMCARTVTYTKGSQFESNLNTVLDRLLQSTDRTGFNISVYGQSPDQIYGLLQCRADQTVDQCYNCSQLATTTIRQICGIALGASIWYDECFLRYDNYSFMGKVSPGNDRQNTFFDGNISNPAGFSGAVEKLLYQLSAKAAPEPKRFAFGPAVDSLSRKIYGMVQCTRDLSTDTCTGCLQFTIDSIFKSYVGVTGVRVWGEGCIVRYDIYPFISTTALALPPAETPPISSRDKSSNKTPIILGVVGVLALLLIICVFATVRRLKSAIFRRGYEVHEHVEENTPISEQVEEDTSISRDEQIVFTMETLLAATANFHDDNQLGEGGFGPVYKGTLPDGREIAVKKLSMISKQGKTEFLNEVKLVAKIQHRNLVTILGCCSEGSEKSIVYEYLPNKSLDKILFDPNKRIRLDWQKRYDIIMGVARGLLYLHQDSQLRIIHRDIKASNILLDENLTPKIADFGLARLFHHDETHVSTRVAGTYGYMAPEYAMQGQLSVKADVYSFGVLLLEVITGRKNTDYNLSPEMQMLLGWAWRLYEGGNAEQMIDRIIIKTCDEQQALRCIHVGLLCTQVDASLRPPMSKVTVMLSTDSVTTLPEPTKPTVLAASSLIQNTKSTGSGSGLSHASATTSSSSFLTPHAPPSTELVPR